MRIPLSWLRELVPVEAEPDELAARLSLTGLAVEEVIRTGAGIDGVVVGEVLDVREHPDADNLVLVRATDGSTERDIVCGARNFGTGDRVPMALPGARLPGGMEIGRRVVRGETSDGMLCSARELEISDDHSGILVLDADAPLGKDIVGALDLDDVILDIDVTPNRGDCLSVLGVAREVAAIFGVPLRVPAVQVPEGDTPVETLASLRIEHPRGCPRYVARVIENVTPGPSPWWLRRRLLAAGMRPISNVVDVTNYVMLERGQPLHAFDLDRLRGEAIVVRRPRLADERTFTTLDGLERALDRGDVMICDAEVPVAIGGVMGGAESEVGADTRRILLESAWFDPIRIARTARRLGLRTEASIRFERGVDREGAPAAADRAMELLAALTGGTVARGAIDEHPGAKKPRPIRARVARVNALIGIEQPAEEMAASLRALGCDVDASRTALRVTPPSWRPDLGIEEDIVEEVARLYGYDRVPSTLPAGARVGGLDPEQQRRRRARRLLMGAGLSEAATLSLLPSTLADRLGVSEGHPLRRARRLANPLSEDEMVLRPSLAWGLLLAAQRNVARRVLPVRLFEIGTVFLPNGDGSIAERRHAAWVLTGPAGAGWHGASRPLDFFDAKGVLEALVAGLGIDRWEIRPLEPTDWSEVLHPGRSAWISVAGRIAGYLAELAPRTAEALELPRRVALAAVDLDALTSEAQEGSAPRVPRYPAVTRDIALVVPDETLAADVEAMIHGAGGDLLEEMHLFDVYQGAPIPEGQRSLAFALCFRHPERTLTDADADQVFGRIAAACAAAGWAVRD